MLLEQVEQMLGIVKQQIAVLRDLAALAERKAQVLVKGDLPALDTLIKGEQALTFRLGRLEDQRFALQTKLARAEGLPTEALRLEEVCRRVPADLSERCVAAAEEFASVLDNLQFQNALNTDLTQQAMAFTDYNLHVLGARRGTSAGKTNYAPGGKAPGSTKTTPNRRLDGRA